MAASMMFRNIFHCATDFAGRRHMRSLDSHQWPMIKEMA
ncbi:hypothetical protein BBB_1840 [Bifidobacterium bifidum BGN4]|uniref:Uncharacterized protein n=2 Tax=Bifidobacterium bifidum TaxID=1681 RepID=I3WKL7_BIFBI|nr:hypothetical protein BBB_1840 [Bifidobacterium bifidum BGN4]BBA47979.1 hypothetical protein BBJK_01411 [Bifidobacterium bifidum LMG 13195]